MPDLDLVVEQLCAPSSLETVLHHPLHDSPMPSLEELGEIMSRLKATLFPGYFGVSCVHVESMRYHLSANLDSIFRKLAEQIRRGGCFACASYATDCMSCEEVSMRKAMEFMQRLPHIRRLLASDAKAAYEGDPAATSAGETIFCYPSLLTMTHHRIAHELYENKVAMIPRMMSEYAHSQTGIDINPGAKIIPRIISEMAHSATGIDIHPGATIDEEFFIDHGTGVVIGETAVIGKGCRLYQGVTLGALSFPKDGDGVLVKGVPRHPILEDNVTVYAGATILGRITIGSGSIIGGNVWVTKDVPAGTKLVQKLSAQPTEESLMGKA